MGFGEPKIYMFDSFEDPDTEADECTNHVFEHVAWDVSSQTEREDWRQIAKAGSSVRVDGDCRPLMSRDKIC